jgi:H+/gluconate symporter-like permease
MILQHDTLDQTMFWTGAMFAFTPVIFAGIVLAVWWRGRKRQIAEERARRQAEEGTM